MTPTTRLTGLGSLALLSFVAAIEAAPAVARVQPVTTLAFSPDGTLLLAAHSNVILVLSSKDATLVRTLEPDRQRITSVAVEPGGELIAVAGGIPGASGRVLLLDRMSGRVLARAGGFGDVTTCVTFSPDGKRIAATSADGTVRLFSILSAPDRLDPSVRLEGHAGPVLSVVFCSDGRFVVTAGADRSIKVWDAVSGKLTRTLSNHTGAVQCLAPRPAARGAGAGGDPAPFSCASGADDHSVRVWQPQVGRMVRIVRGHEGPIFSVCYAPDGSRLFSAGAEGIVSVIDADSDRIERQWNASADWIYTLAVSPDGKFLATGDWAANVKIWNLAKKPEHPEASYPTRPGRVVSRRYSHATSRECTHSSR